MYFALPSRENLFIYLFYIFYIALDLYMVTVVLHVFCGAVQGYCWKRTMVRPYTTDLHNVL